MFTLIYLVIYRTGATIMLHLYSGYLLYQLRFYHSPNIFSKNTKIRHLQSFNYCAPGWRLHTFPLQPLGQDFQAYVYQFAFFFSNGFSFGPITIIQQENAECFVVCAYPLRNVDFPSLPREVQ